MTARGIVLVTKEMLAKLDAAFAKEGKQRGPDYQIIITPPPTMPIDAMQDYAALGVHRLLPNLGSQRPERVQERMAEWANMTPVERGRARQNFQELRNLPHADRQALWEAYRALPDEQRQALAQGTRPSAKPSEAASVPSGKRMVAVNPPPVIVKPVSPTVVQAKPGATTTLVTKAPSPPAHHQPGLPKIAATDEFVNPTTLLPSRGPQGAATRAAVARVRKSPLKDRSVIFLFMFGGPSQLDLFDYKPELQYNVAPSAGLCSIQLVGDPGTQFELIQS